MGTCRLSKLWPVNKKLHFSQKLITCNDQQIHLKESSDDKVKELKIIQHDKVKHNS